MTVKPGQSGNPAGPKPGYHHGKTYLLKVIKELAKTTDGKTIEVGEAIVRAQVKNALTGDTRAFNAVFDRIDGKAPQSIAMTVKTSPIEKLTDDQLAAILANLPNNPMVIPPMPKKLDID